MSEMFEEPPKPPALVNSWPSGLSIEVGLNDLAAQTGAIIMSDEDICRQFDISLAQLESYKKHPAFKAEVRENLNQIRDSNATIKRKAKASLEYYMDTYQAQWLASDASLGDKLKLMQFIAKLAGIDAAEKAAEAAALAEANKSSNAAQSNQPQIVIQLTQAPSQQVPVTLTAERVE